MSHTITGTELTALIKKAMRGDVRAFEQLIETFSEDIFYNLFIRLDEQNRADVEDAAQEVVLALHKSIGKLKSPHAFYAYLSTVVHNMATKYNLKGSRIRTEDVDEHEQADQLPAPQTEQPEEAFDRKQATVMLASYMERLPQKQREVLYLYYYRDLSYAEIAERLDITTSTVGTNISKAKGALKKMLEESGEFKNEAKEAQGGADKHDASGADTLAGFAAAPLVHDAIDHTMTSNALIDGAKTLAANTQVIIGAHPEVAAAGAALVAPKVLKGVGLAVIALITAVGGFFGMQAASVSCNNPDQVVTTVSADYVPEAHIVFVGGTEGVEADQVEPGSGAKDSSQTDPSEAEHINPESAMVTLADGTAGQWKVVTVGTETVVLQGDTPPAELTSLGVGHYTIVFELTSSEGKRLAVVQRDFMVEQQ